MTLNLGRDGWWAMYGCVYGEVCQALLLKAWRLVEAAGNLARKVLFILGQLVSPE